MLKAISPIDGRYASKTSSYVNYFSEYALIKYRVKVEIYYFKALVKKELPQLSKISEQDLKPLDEVIQNFDITDAQRIKDIEKVTNHDVKAVEYFLKEVFERHGLSDYKEFIHFGLTSQDINNTAIPLSLKEALYQVHLPELDELISKIRALAKTVEHMTILARTHGQPASPTNFGKEFMVFVNRLEMITNELKNYKIYAKFGGATGNFNAHAVTFPEHDWIAFGNSFVSSYLGLERLQFTTQIEHYDHMAMLFNFCKTINNILIDFCRDLWTYISMDYFKQKIMENEVGSSAMPHKVNPIDFENAEGNLGVANALFDHLANKLPISRLQRDLTDSTVLRNIGVPFAHSLIAITSIKKGIAKLLLNEGRISSDLENNWAVVAEAIQNILRREGYANPYETLKALTRVNKKIDQEAMHQFIDDLDVSSRLKTELKSITPTNYSGVYPKF